MNRKQMLPHIHGGLLVAGLLGVAAALGQDPGTLAELKTWHDKLVRPGEVVSVEDGKQAQEKLKVWKLPLAKLESEQRGQALRLEIYAALAIGDAARAAEFLPELQRAFPDTTETLHAAWLVAGASGDGELAKRTLDKLKEQKAASEKALATRLARLRMVGQAAPDMSVGTEDGKFVALRQRDGVVLVLDFWQQREKPGEKQVKALRGLFEAYAGQAAVQFLGVNSDAADDVDAAKKLAADSGYKWPQHFEQKAADAPLTKAAFHVESSPWTVIIDMEGNVRWVAAASDPEFQYALRAAAAEAKGEFASVRPKTVEGVAAVVKAKPKVAPAEEKKEEKPVASGDLPHNPEAESMLDQARVYLKTGRKTDAKKLLQEIVEKYPGTWEAKDAKERLDAM